MPRRYRIRTKSGQVIPFMWNAPGKPSPQDMKEIVNSYREGLLQKGREEIGKIREETQSKIPSTGRFAQEHPILSQALEALQEPLLPEIAPPSPEAGGIEGAARDIYSKGIRPISSPAMLGTIMTAGAGGGLGALAKAGLGVMGGAALYSGGKELPGAVSRFAQEPSLKHAEELQDPLLQTGMGGLMVAPILAGKAAPKPEVLPPVRGLLPEQATPPPEAPLLGPKPIITPPPAPPEGLGGVEPPMLPPAKPPIIVGGQVARSAAEVTPAKLPQEIQRPIPLPGKIAPVQVLKYDPKTGEAHFIGPNEQVETFRVDRATKMEVQEHQKISGEPEPAKALEDVINSKVPQGKFSDADLKVAADMGDASAAQELARRSVSEQAPLGLVRAIGDIKGALSGSETLTPLKASDAGIEGVGEGSPPIKTGLENLTDRELLDIYRSPSYEPNSSLEAEMEGRGLIVGDMREALGLGPGKWQAGQKEIISPSIPNVQPPQDFITDPSTGRQVPIQHLPPVEPPEPTEFGKPAEEFQVKERTKAERLERMKKRQDDILKRLIEEEGGSFTPGEILGGTKRLLNYDELADMVRRGVAYHGTTLEKAESIMREGLSPLNFGRVVNEVMAKLNITKRDVSRSQKKAITSLYHSYSNQFGTASVTPGGEIAARWAGSGGEIARQVASILTGKSEREVQPLIGGKPAIIEGELVSGTDSYSRALKLVNYLDRNIREGYSTPEEAAQELWHNYFDIRVKPSEFIPKRIRTDVDNVIKRLVEEEGGGFAPDEIWNWVKETAKGKEDREKSVGFSAARARFGAIQHTMRKNPQTAPIADLFTRAEDYQDIFTSVFSRMANEALKLPLKGRVQSWEILNTYFDPLEAVGKSDSKGVPFSQEAIQSAINQRDLTLRVHQMLPIDATKADKSAGFIPNYMTHIREVARGDTEFAKSFDEIWNQLARDPASNIMDFFRSEKTFSKEKGEPVGLVDRGYGRPRSPFVERRSGKITTLETDPLRIWPVYLESIGRLIFRKPVVKMARQIAGDISEGTTKEAATQYIRHFAGYTDFPNLRSTTGRAINVALRAGARSVLGFSPRLQELHFGRLLTNVFPELGPKYSAYGVGEFLRSPKEAMQQARNLGLAQQSKIPFRMKTTADKLDYILFWGDLGNTMARAMAYKGFLKRAVDSGLKGQDATMKAIGDLKDSDQWVGSSRYIPLFDPENPIFRTVTQYKTIPTMIADQYARILGQWRSNPSRVLYAAIAAYIGYQAQKHYGIHLFHLTPSNLKFTGAAVENQASKVISKIGKGEFAEALKDMIPASGPIREVLTIGPAASEEERSKYFRSRSAQPKKSPIGPVRPITPGKPMRAF